MNDTNYGIVLGGLLSSILLILYTCLVGHMIIKVISLGNANNLEPYEFSNGTIYIVTTIGGLFSALVIAKLTITSPGVNPGKIEMAPSNWVTGLVWCYLVIWLLVGVTTLTVGTILYPTISQTLNDMGTTWLGLAITAGFAYFGLKPNNNINESKTPAHGTSASSNSQAPNSAEAPAPV